MGSDAMPRRAPSTEGAAFAQRLLAENREELARADNKAATLLAAALIIVGALLAGFVAGDWSVSSLPSQSLVLWWVAVALAAVGICLLAAALAPRRMKRTEDSNRLAYFGDVANLASCDDLVEALDKAAKSDGARYVDQLFVTSQILSAKYSCIYWGMILLVGASFAGLLAVFAR